MEVEDTLTNRGTEGIDIRCELLLHIAIADSHIIVLVVEVVVGIWCRDELHERKEILDWLWFDLVEHSRPRIGDCTHDFLLDSSLVVAEIDGIAFALTHFAAAIQARNFDGFGIEVERLWFLEVLNIVDAVESACEEACHLHILLLIFADRNFVCLVYKDVCCHE